MPRINAEGIVVHRPRLVSEAVIAASGRRRCDNWIATFLDYTDQAESPIDYLRWVALATICGAAQRKVYMDMLYFNVMSNMYIVLTGPPGTKKSTAIRAGRRLLGKVPGINMSADAPSVAGIMEDFKEINNPAHQSLNAFIYEFSSLFENAPETMSQFLTAIYDGDDDYIKRTRIAGKEHITAPWFNLMAGTTPSWLGDNLSKSAIEGGFVARTLYVFSDEINFKTSRPRGSPRYDKLREDLVHDLAHIAQISGEFDFDGGEAGEAFVWYDGWYMNPARIPRMADFRMQGYYVRKPIHLLKVAMAVSMAKKDERVLTVEDLLEAKALLEAIEPGMKRAFITVGGNSAATELERVEQQILANPGGLSYSQILRANVGAIDKRMLDGILDSLVAMEDTVSRRVGKDGEWRYYPL